MGHGIGYARDWYLEARVPACSSRYISTAGLSREREGFRGSTHSRSSSRFQMTRPRLPVTRWSIRSRHFSSPRSFSFISRCTGVFGDSLLEKGESNLRVDNPREILIDTMDRVSSVCDETWKRGC